ncbi:alpha/beta hydrolase family protein [Singulisphaera rosea]
MPRRSTILPALPLFFLTTAWLAPHAFAEDAISTALTRPIIGPKQTLAEAADYCELAIPRTPSVKSVGQWELEAKRLREESLRRVIFRGEADAWRRSKLQVQWLDTVEGGPGYRIKKLRYEAVPGLWIPALLYEPTSLSGKVPVVLNVNGHDKEGKSADYKQVICINQAKRGMLVLNTEWFGMGQFGGGDYRHDLINHIDLCGTSGIATHYLAMTRAIDVLLSHENADPGRVAMTGLSGGGWQTIFASAFDTRITLTNPVAGYSSFRTRCRHSSDLGDSEQTPCDLATVTDYAGMTALLAPRAALLTFNAEDNCCFAAGHALPPLLQAAQPIFSLYGKDAQLRTHINSDPGTHNYLVDNRQAFYQMVGDNFYKDDRQFNPQEIPSDSEVKASSVLDVPLPKENASLHSLAIELSRSLPLQIKMPTGVESAKTWRADRAAKLREIVRAPRYDVRATKVGESDKDGVLATSWRLQLGDWSVPVVEFTKGTKDATTLLVNDGGRARTVDEVRGLLDQGRRVVVVDPFSIGEAQVADHAYLYSMLLESVGSRCLGIEAEQLATVARWAKSSNPSTKLTLRAIGPRTSCMALVAAGLEDLAIDRVELSRPSGSLKELLEDKTPYEHSPELFCFGLLRDFDVAQLAALIAPRPLTISQPSERARKEMVNLKAMYQTWGVDWDPFQ